MANFEIPAHLEFVEELRKFETTDPAHADLFNAVVQVLLNNEVYLLRAMQSGGSGSKVLVGPEDTILGNGDTLFIVDGMPGVFRAASFSNMSFGDTPPAGAQYWAGTEAGGGASGAAEAGSIINGRLAVSQEQDAPEGTVFLAKL
ncbi:hypothetical protein BRYFOR_07632 [Marvinbryantia formatexigens DSM 14469]|uniref:Uncharacterized protein n=1 Tax=Marvinbryantia formatexigens DSM 14469 TaxID=478749 RepID=C6LG72_9FIRM|nr:hypothetical protein [Marvinbryantia formatexigens]EET60436.1 hypothetical protein BRYFOR_07632 [Marvinbryantia formatexigens DSM 14469]UWO25225.1 hypothetical protein NQ534_01675 [Marvinbryantia formatexigens DSM 14469]SDH05363.1 hypothetical protein SAMN05660368_03763 [Marvinbryantia formatexigens]